MTRFYPLMCLLLAGLPAAAVAQTISCFSPAVGNVGTLVTLGGTDLDRVTAVAVGGVAAVVLDQTRTVLHLLVLPGAASGPITTTGGASAASAASFTVTRAALNAAQQGPKLVGTGAAGTSAAQGYSVALSADGTTLAVGGYGDGNSSGFSGSGATWVFTRSGTGWAQHGPKLVGTGAVGTYVGQGYSVALSADGATLAVGGQGDDNGAGATWVFTRSGTGWGQQGPKLVGAGAAAGFASQGRSVALSADGATLAVGGYNDDRNRGATWVFTRSGTGWRQQGPKLVGAGAVGSASQGASVALSADGATLAVGGPTDTDNNFDGAAWVFTRSGTNWSQQGPKLVGTGAVGTRVLQGWSVALSADGATLAVGGPSDRNFDGAAWVFTRSGANWSQQGPKLVGAGAVGFAHQGGAVTLSADGATLAVGGYGDGNSSGFRGSGAAWLFTRSGTGWGQQGPKLVGTGAMGSAGQGVSVALSADGATLAVGGVGDDNGTGATWVFSAARSLGVACLPPDAGAFPPFPVAAPNIITPNGDGLNDVFRLPGLPPGPWQLRIYSRWGQQVFASGEYQQDWSAPGLADGLYYYWLQSPARPSLRGWLEVIH